MFKHWKLIDWIIGGIVTVLFLYGPVWFFEHIPNIDPFKIPIWVAFVYILYCTLLAIYWIINKNFKMAFHYALIITMYVGFTIFVILYAAYHG